jgi:hypothetical protein
MRSSILVLGRVVLMLKNYQKLAIERVRENA